LTDAAPRQCSPQLSDSIRPEVAGAQVAHRARRQASSLIRQFRDTARDTGFRSRDSAEQPEQPGNAPNTPFVRHRNSLASPPELSGGEPTQPAQASFPRRPPAKNKKNSSRFPTRTLPNSEKTSAILTRHGGFEFPWACGPPIGMKVYC